MSKKEIPFGFIEGDDIYLNPWGSHPKRKIGEIKEGNEQSSLAYFEEKFKDLSAKVDSLEKDINEAENKGSFLMKLKHLKDSLPAHDGLGDYLPIEEKLVQLEDDLKSLIAQNRVRNKEIKEAMILEAREIEKIINWQESTEKIHDIKTRWIKTGNAPDDVNESLDEDFWDIISRFFERKKSFYEDKKRLMQKRKESYVSLVEEARKIKELHGKERFEKINELKEKWNETGNIPKEEYVELKKEFDMYMKKKSFSPPPQIDLIKLLENLKKFYNREASYHPRDLDFQRKNLIRFKTQHPELKRLRKEAFWFFQLISERDFIEKLAGNRFPDFRQLDEDKKQSIKVGILKELLSRDKEDFAKFEENQANFSAGNREMQQLVDKKINQQKNKIQVKEALLKHLTGV
ncbi:MAG: DUF349 domain-containing protein [Cyclobacteriaceae bacterium]|nr:DUF349 domain-containing protein [Cyclobacteriaceae bacterium SS2]